MFRSEEFPIHPSSQMKDAGYELQYYKKSFFSKSMSNIKTRRSEALKFFLEYLTASCPDEAKLYRMRKFLEVFANIPSVPPVQNSEICRGCYRNLVEKVGYFLVDYEQGTYRNFSAIYRTGIKCIGALSSRIFEVSTKLKICKVLSIWGFESMIISECPNNKKMR